MRLLVLDRPEKRNALTTAAIADLRQRLVEASQEPGVRSVLVTGEGVCFSAGVDLNEFAGGTPNSARELIVGLRDLCAEARTMPLPVACAIRGHCVGGALELALAADFRVCAPDARFSMPEVAVGLPSVIDAALLVSYIGLGRARELVLTGDAIDAEQALAWGLVNRVVPEERLLDSALELLERVTRHAPPVVGAQKGLVESWLSEPFGQAVDGSVEVLVDSFRSGLPQRIARRLLERRPGGVTG